MSKELLGSIGSAVGLSATELESAGVFAEDGSVDATKAAELFKGNLATIRTAAETAGGDLKKEEYERSGKKAVYTEVETFFKDKLGLDIKYTENGLETALAHVVKTNELTDNKVEGSAYVKALLTTQAEEKAKLVEGFQTTLSEQETSYTRALTAIEVEKQIRADKGFIMPTGENAEAIFSNWIIDVTNDLMNVTRRTKEGAFIVVNEKGEQAKDPTTYKDINYSDTLKRVAKSRIPYQAGNGVSTGSLGKHEAGGSGNGGGATDVIKFMVDGKPAEIKMPEFKTEGELIDFVSKSKLPKEVIDLIEKHFDTKE